MKDQPSYKTTIQSTNSINIIAYIFVAIAIYLIYFLVNLLLAEGPNTRSSVFIGHLPFLIIVALAIPALILWHKKNVLDLMFYNNDGIIHIEILDKLKKKKIVFHSPLEIDFYYVKEKVSARYGSINVLYAGFYKAKQHLFTLSLNHNSISPPPVLFKEYEKIPLEQSEKGRIYYTSKLLEIIPHLS